MLCLLFNIILYSEVSLLSLPYRGNKSHLAIGQLPSLQSFSKPCQHALLLFLKMQFHCCKSGWPEHHRHSGLCANCFSHDTSEHTYCFCTPWLKKHHLVSLRVLGCWMPCHSRMNVKKNLSSHYASQQKHQFNLLALVFHITHPSDLWEQSWVHHIVSYNAFGVFRH